VKYKNIWFGSIRLLWFLCFKKSSADVFVFLEKGLTNNCK